MSERQPIGFLANRQQTVGDLPTKEANRQQKSVGDLPTGVGETPTKKRWRNTNKALVKHQQGVGKTPTTVGETPTYILTTTTTNSKVVSSSSTLVGETPTERQTAAKFICERYGVSSLIAADKYPAFADWANHLQAKRINLNQDPHEKPNCLSCFKRTVLQICA